MKAWELLLSFNLLLFIFLISGCGNHPNSKSSDLDSYRPFQGFSIQEVDEGDYKAILRPINTHLYKEINGVMKLKIENNQFKSTLDIYNAPKGIKHIQYILMRDHCPHGKFDTNNDGIIDFSEIVTSDYPVLLPLDSNLIEQLSGIDYGPISNEDGYYYYQRSASFNELMADLKSTDPDPFDLIGKLAFSERLKLDNKVIVIFAFDNEIDSRQMLPLACGKISRIYRVESN